MSGLSSAVSTLGAVVVGGVLTTSGQLLLERSKSKREANREEAKEARSLRLAVRLVTEELAESISLIEEAAKTGRYWVGPRQLPTATWNEYRPDIASAIDDAGRWRHVTAAYDAINNLNWVVDHRRRASADTTGHTQGFFIQSEDQTREAWRAIREAILALEETLSVPPPASRIGVGSRERQKVEGALWPYGDGADFDEDEAMRGEQQEHVQREVWKERGV